MYIWLCVATNGATSFKDYHVCRAFSRKSYKTKEAAEKAGKGHRCKLGYSKIEIKDIGKRKKV